MIDKPEKKNLFQIKFFIILFAMMAVSAWACAFPLIKLGLAEFAIDSANAGGKTLFAGFRFLFAGIFTLLIAGIKGNDLKVKGTTNWLWLVLFGLVNTALHYFFFYMGLSNSPGSRASIFDSLGTFFLVIFACIVFKDEHMTIRKTIGCLLGFTGIVVVNLDVNNLSGFFGDLTFKGDGMIVINAVCCALGGLITRVITQKINALAATGYSLSIGGVMLLVFGKLMGGYIPQVTLKGLFILFLLICVSTVGFSLYNQLLCFNPVGEIAIFNSFIPILGAMLSCIILGEPFHFKLVVAGVLIMAGVITVNRNKTK